jgi:predicted Rossmann fold nucleotide-binding protein DprA/Smf involved in DNA uptake
VGAPVQCPRLVPFNEVVALQRRVGRRKGSGTRAAQALSAVQGQPGITIPELAAKIGIQTTYLYRVLPGLEQEGKVEKKGRGWFPREGRAAG